MVIGLFVIASVHAMQEEHIDELYKLCQVWFDDHHIKTIASHIAQIYSRRGSFISKKGALEVRSVRASAQFNTDEQCVTFHKIDFPGVAREYPMAKVTFDEVLKIKALIEAKNKT